MQAQVTRRGDRGILQTHPRLQPLRDLCLLQQDLPCTSGCIAVPAVPRVPAIAHVYAIAGEGHAEELIVPFKAPKIDISIVFPGMFRVEEKKGEEE